MCFCAGEKLLMCGSIIIGIDDDDDDDKLT